MHGVTAGYLLAGSLAALIFFGMGWLVLPLLPLFLIWHALRCLGKHSSVVHSHEAFLLKSHMLMALLLLLLYALPLGWVLSAMDPGSELAAVIGTRDPATIAHWLKLWLADQLRDPSGAFALQMASGFFWFASHALLSLAVGIYAMVRLLRRFLRWSDRQPA